MEGGLISVNSSFTLPSQPTSGRVERIPLGGDGFYAPDAAYAVIGHTIEGSADGGSMSLTVIMDPRFCALISYMTLQVNQVSSADLDVRFNISDANLRVPRLLEQDLVTATAATIAATTVGKTWNPPAMVLPGGSGLSNCSVTLPNTLNDDMFLDVLIYLFNIRVRETTPMGPLLWARGST